MPLVGNSQANPAATWEPQAADTRLAHTAGADPAGVFSSDLSVPEYVLLSEAGLEPLGFVVGSSIYHAPAARDFSETYLHPRPRFVSAPDQAGCSV